MNWFESELNGQVIHLIRHPIPTTLSRKELPNLEPILKDETFCSEFLSSKQLEYSKNLIKIGTFFQKGVLSWCLQNLLPLNIMDSSHRITVSYEELVMRSKSVLRRIFDILELDDLNSAFKTIDKASQVSSKSAPETQEILRKETRNSHDRVFLIEKWRKSITNVEELQAFDILEKFEIDAYKMGNLMPSEPYLIVNS